MCSNVLVSMYLLGVDVYIYIHIYIKVYIHLCYIRIRVCIYTHASIHVPACICLSLVELCLTSKACWCHCSSANILFLLCKAWPRVSPWRVQLIPRLHWRTTSKLLEARSLVFFVICILLSMNLSVLVDCDLFCTHHLTGHLTRRGQGVHWVRAGCERERQPCVDKWWAVVKVAKVIPETTG